MRRLSLTPAGRAITALLCAGGAFAFAAAPASGDQLLVKFRGAASAAAGSDALAGAGAERAGSIGDLGIRVVEVPSGTTAGALRSLEASSAVKFAERDGRVQRFAITPNDPWWPNQTSSAHVNLPQAWGATLGSSDVSIAVIDSGVTYGLEDMPSAFAPGYDFASGDSDPSDSDGHGTYVAGVAAARGNNGVGIAGSCWQCRVMPLRTALTISQNASAITWAADHGARVINMSWGTTTDSSTLSSAISYAANHGAVLIASAGNYGTSTPVYPAAYSSVIGVAGSDPNDAINANSSRGSWVDVAAPNCNMSTTRTGSYTSFCGTSSAAPLVAGIAGLAASQSPSATSQQIRNALETTAVPMSGNPVAYGRVDAGATIAALGGSSGGSAPANTALPTVSGTAQDGQTLTATTGSWSNSPSTYAYQWKRCDSSGANCTAVSGATSQNYTLSSADVGSTIRLAVTASNSYGSASATSNSTGAVTAAAPPAPAQSTATFTGSVSAKQASKTFSLAVGSGDANATLTFTKASSLTVTLIAPDGSTVGTASGASGVQLSRNLPAGNYRYVVSGSVSKGSASFTLAVGYTTP